MGLFDLFKRNKDQPSADKNKFYPLVVADIVHETPNAISVYFEIPPNLTEVFRYSAGQYITLRMDIADETVLRSYSLSSCPYTDSYFRIAIKRKPGGKMSGYAIKHLKKGSTVDVFTPLGDFSPNLQSPAPAYGLIAGGSGITPMLSIAKALLSQTKATVSLLYANRSLSETLYAAELEALQQQYAPRLHLTYVFDEMPADSFSASAFGGIWTVANYIHWVQQQASHLPLLQTQYYVCGPTGMMQTAEQALNDLGVYSSAIHIEYFDISRQPLRHTSVPPPTEGGNVKVQLTIGQQTTQFTMPAQSTVLESALNAGLDVPYMCEAGVCASCRAKLIKGEVRMQECYSLSPKEIAEKYILTCQALPLTPEIEINYDL